MEKVNLNKRLSMLIYTCDKYSDLWDANIHLLNKYWGDRNIKTVLATDCETDRVLDSAEIVGAGANSEFSERTTAALEKIDTEYVLVSLDDYFLIEKVDNEEIKRLIDIMDKEKLDYIRLFSLPTAKRKDKWKEYPGLYHVNPQNRYSVNLYVGIWRRDFLLKTAKEKKNAWQYEVSLCKSAVEYNAQCAMTKGGEFKILDVVRKGKLLRKANRYLKKHDLYHGDRPLIERKEEIRIFVVTYVILRILPPFAKNAMRKLMIKRGFKIYNHQMN